MVATVTKINSARSVVRYFSRDGYYADGDPEHRKASSWHGRGAAALKLGRHVLPKRFSEIMRGEAPGAGVRLGTIREGVLEHEAGRDVTFSAPKSVSLAALVDGDRRVLRAHDEAVRAALDWIEEELLLTRQWDRERRRHRRVLSPCLVAAVFRHLANRNLDPQLHSHAVIANMTRTGEGVWRSLDLGSLSSSEMLIGAYYRNELAARLLALGYELEPALAGPVPSFEVRGYGRRVLRSFSTRRQQIEDWVKRHGVANTPSRRRQAALATRRRKEEPDRAAMAAMWVARAREMGLPGRKAQAMRRRRRRLRATAVSGGSLAAAEVVWRAMEHLEERRSVFTGRSLETQALGHSPGAFRLPELRAAARGLERDGLLVAARGRRDASFATERMLRAERDIVARMRAGLGAGAPVIAAGLVDEGLAARGLTDGQARAVRHALCSHDRILGVQGYAGTGKTAMLREVVRLAGADRVVGLAPTAVAARALGEEAGMPARTLAWFLARHRDAADGLAGAEALAALRRRFSGTVLVLDEASMVGTVQMQDLMRVAEALGVERLALVGDMAQLRAVDAGGPFRLLQRSGLPVAVMDEILRQRTPALKAAVDAAVDREPALAVERLGDDVHEVEAGALGETAGRLWLGLDEEARRETVLLAPTHELRERINATVREALAEEGVLHGRTLMIERLVSRGMTRAQKGDIRNWVEGDEVVFLHDIWGGKARAGEGFAVTGVEEGRVRLEHADGRRLSVRPAGRVRYQVELYETRRLEIRAGDRIRWTRNDAARGLANGDRAEVVEIGPRKVRFRGEDGRVFALSRKDMQLRHLDHAWSSTVHGAQGITRDTVIAVLDSGHGALTDQATFYVELTRARDRVVVLTDNREDLMGALEAAAGERVSALEAVGEDPAVAALSDREELWPQLSAWRAHAARAAEAGVLAMDMTGHEEVLARLGRLAARRNLPCPPPAAVAEILAAQEAEAGRRREVEAWLGEVGESAAARRMLVGEAAALPLTDLPGWRAWRKGAEARAQAGRRLLDDGDYRLHVERRPEIRSEVDCLEAALALDDACAALLADWRAHGEAAGAAGIHPFHADGHGALAARLEEAAGREDLPPGTAARFAAMLEEHAALVKAGETVAHALPAYRRAEERRAGLAGEAAASDLPVTDLPAWKDRREEAGALIRAGRALLEGERFGIHLDRDPADRALVERVVAAAEADNLLAGALDTWRAHVGVAAADGLSPFDAQGTEEAMAPLAALAAQDGLPVALPRNILALIAEHAREMRARAAIRDWQDGAEEIGDRRARLVDEAGRRGLAVAELPGWTAWRADAGSLLDRGTGLLDDAGVMLRLARDPARRAAARTSLRTIRAAIHSDDAAAALLGEWRAHVDTARAAGIRTSRSDGHADLVARLDAMARRPGLDEPTAACLAGLAGQNEDEERDRMRNAVRAAFETLFGKAGDSVEGVPYQIGYEAFRETLGEARGLFDPASETGKLLARLETQFGRQDDCIRRVTALNSDAERLTAEMNRLQGKPWGAADRPIHERAGFHAWREEADRFLAVWDALRQDPAMALHLDRPPSSSEVLDMVAGLFRRAEVQAPATEAERQAAERLRRTQGHDRSEGGGLSA